MSIGQHDNFYWHKPNQRVSRPTDRLTDWPIDRESVVSLYVAIVGACLFIYKHIYLVYHQHSVISFHIISFSHKITMNRILVINCAWCILRICLFVVCVPLMAIRTNFQFNMEQHWYAFAYEIFFFIFIYVSVINRYLKITSKLHTHTHTHI